MIQTSYDFLNTEIGQLLIAGTERGLVRIHLPREGRAAEPDDGWRHDPEAVAEAVAQLRAYFAGELRVFDLPLDPQGTDFQRRVWQALAEIPYGETTSYSELAGSIGRPAAVRAVGAANGKNPLPIVLPCHRVIGADGSLTGFGGGLEMKRYLLELEGVVVEDETQARAPRQTSLLSV